MDYPPAWTFPHPEAMYDSTHPTNPFSANVSSFFRRPSKIVKSGSRNPSPRHSGRRRTNSTVPVTRTRSVLDKQRLSVPPYPNPQIQPRPVSWHPNSYVDFNLPNQDFSQLAVNNQYQPFNPYVTTAVNGLVTPMSYSIVDEPQIQELITPLEELSAQEVDANYSGGFDGSQYWFQSEIPKQQHYTMDAMFQQQAQYQPNWQWNNRLGLDVPTAPSSPDFLPIQGGVEASPLSLDDHKVPVSSEGEELVGMGLYDSPAEIQSSSSLFFGGAAPSMAARRSLKLEDSFEPAPEGSDAEHEQDDDEDDNDDDDAREDLEEKESSSVPLYAEQYTHPISNSLIDHSFFFEQDSNAGLLPYATNTTYLSDGVYNAAYPGCGWV